MKFQDIGIETRTQLIRDYFNWDSQISKAESGELSDFEIAQVKRSFDFLRKEFGESFPQDCFENDNSINHYFINRAPWTRMWFNWLAHAIEELSTSYNIESVLKKIRSHREEDFYEARSILEAGLKLNKAGFTIQIDTDITNDKGQKKRPDLVITNEETREQAIIEITRLTKTPEDDKYQLLIQNLYLKGLEYRNKIQFAGRLLKDVSNEHLEELTREINSKLSRSIAADKFQEINHEGIIEFAFSPANNPIMIEWAKSKNYELDSFSFPQKDFIGRIRAKVTHKKEQLSSEFPSILLIRIEGFWLNSASYESIKDGLLKTIHKCPQILSVILISSEMNTVEKMVSSTGFNFYVERTERHGFTTKTIMLFNRFCKTKITPHTLMRIYDAFESH